MVAEFLFLCPIHEGLRLQFECLVINTMWQCLKGIRYILRGLEIPVEDVNTETIANTDQVGVVLGQLVDGLDLLLQEFALQVVGQMGVVVGAGQLVQVKKGLVDLLLQVQSELDGGQWSGEFVLGRAVDGRQDNASTTQVLVLDELLGVLVLLLGGLLEELGEAFQGNIVTIVVSSL